MWYKQGVLLFIQKSLSITPASTRDDQKENVFPVRPANWRFPVAGWPRPACSYVKRVISTLKWYEKIYCGVDRLIIEIKDEISRSDAVQGKWAVPTGSRSRVCCDASSLAMGVLEEISDDVVADACWLRDQTVLPTSIL